jgi:quinoprotein glucose dehydrogenase
MNPDRQHQTCRGVTYYARHGAGCRRACADRVYLPTSDARLIALDAADGKVCTSFADQGTLHLEKGMKYNPAGYYYSTSPPVAAGKLIVGGAVNDNYSTQEQSGVIRAFDINTGALIWNWDSGNPDVTTPLPEGPDLHDQLAEQLVGPQRRRRARHGLRAARQPGARPARHGPQRQCREVLVVDRRARHQYRAAEMGAADRAPRSLGHGRPGPAGALRHEEGRRHGRSGTRRPHQAGRHLRARPPHRRADHPVQGNPGTRRRDPRRSYVADAADLRPHLLAAAAAGKDMWGVSLFDQLACRIEFHRYKYEGRYTPPSLQGSIIYPGNFGTFNWGSVAVDPERQIMFGMPTYLAFTSRLVPRADIPPRARTKGQRAGPEPQ